jgi:hypothetical protein
MCKELPVILVNMVVDPKRIIGKMEGQGGEAQGVADPPPPKKNFIDYLKLVYYYISLHYYKHSYLKKEVHRTPRRFADLTSSPQMAVAFSYLCTYERPLFFSIALQIK